MQKLSSKPAWMPCLLSLFLVAASPAFSGVLGYPSTDHASFLVDIPDGWTIEPGEEEGDYVDVDSPDGVYLAFRTIEGSESAMQEAIEDSVAYLQENYRNVSVGEPVSTEQQGGLTAFYMDGTGKDEEGTAMTFRMAWIALEDGKIGEIWFAAPVDAKGDIAKAAKVLGSFRAP